MGDPGNVANTDGYGSVAYAYQIGEYDVTVGQYVQFLNAVAKTDTYGVYNSGMAGDYPTISITQSGSSGDYSYSVAGSDSQAANCPIFDVTWGDAARFCNWLQNGQPSYSAGTPGEVAGSTETGAYTLYGDTTSYYGNTQYWGQLLPPVGERMVQGRTLQGRKYECRVLGLRDAKRHATEQRIVRDRHEQRQ